MEASESFFSMWIGRRASYNCKPHVNDKCRDRLSLSTLNLYYLTCCALVLVLYVLWSRVNNVESLYANSGDTPETRLSTPVLTLPSCWYAPKYSTFFFFGEWWSTVPDAIKVFRLIISFFFFTVYWCEAHRSLWVFCTF